MKSSRFLLVISLVLMFCAAGWTQTTGSITGTVTDATGAAVSGANVTIANPEHGITRQMATNSTGEYNQSGLPAGTYNVVVIAAGFKKFEAKGVKLDVAEKASAYTPVPGGVGPLTIAMLMSNTVKAAKMRRGTTNFVAAD